MFLVNAIQHRMGRLLGPTILAETLLAISCSQC